MSNVNDTDLFLVNRAGVSYNVEAQDIQDLQDSDLFLVNRGANSYKVEKGDIDTKVLDTDLLLCNRNGVSYKVDGGAFKTAVGCITDPVIACAMGTGQTVLSFNSIKGFGCITTGTAVQQDAAVTPVTSAVTSVTTIIDAVVTPYGSGGGVPNNATMNAKTGRTYRIPGGEVIARSYASDTNNYYIDAGNAGGNGFFMFPTATATGNLYIYEFSSLTSQNDGTWVFGPASGSAMEQANTMVNMMDPDKFYSFIWTGQNAGTDTNDITMMFSPDGFEIDFQNTTQLSNFLPGDVLTGGSSADYASGTSYSGTYHSGTPALIYDGKDDTSLMGRPNGFTISFASGTLPIGSTSYVLRVYFESGSITVTATDGTTAGTTGSAGTYYQNVTVDSGVVGKEIASIEFSGGSINDGAGLYWIKVDGVELIESRVIASPYSTSSNMIVDHDTFSQGDTITGVEINGSGTCASKDTTAKTMTLTVGAAPRFAIGSKVEPS